MSEKELREQVKAVGVRLLDANLVQGTWGNISVRVDGKKILVTPKGMDYYLLTPEDMVVLDTETMEYVSATGRKPTSEKGIHAGILSSRSEIGAAIHSHPLACSVFACAHAAIPLETDEQKKLFNCDEVPCADYGLPSTGKLTKNTLKGMGNANAVLMANHGVVCCGKTLEDAYKLLETLENLAASLLAKK